MSDIKVNAHLNLKEQPATLYVSGSILTFSDDDKIVLQKAEPQGTNHTILLLNLIVEKGKLPKKGTEKPFSFESSDGVDLYKKVTIFYDTDESRTIDIKIMG